MTELERFFAEAKAEFGLEASHEDLEQIHCLPEGFRSSCWHNNACPSLSAVQFDIGPREYTISCDIWIDAKEPDLRECGSAHQFNIVIGSDEGEQFTYGSDSWTDILTHAALAYKLQRAMYKETVSQRDTEARKVFDAYQDKAEEYGFVVL